MIRRGLKSQIQRDIKRVYLNLNDFAVLETIRYYRNGRGQPPLELRIPIVVNADENMNSVWNKNKAQQRIGSDQTIYQMEKVLFCALEDFNPPPKKGRRMELCGHAYETLSVSQEFGMLKIELRELEE